MMRIEDESLTRIRKTVNPPRTPNLMTIDGTMEGSSSKRRRPQNNDCPTLSSLISSQPKKHLYLALDDWNGGYSIHRIDADDILDQGSGGGENKLPEPAALRLASPGAGPMAFAALGTSIFVATNLGRLGDRAPPTLVYDTKTGALAIGPRVPDWISDLGDAMTVGEKLYALTSVPFHMSSSLHALSWGKTVIPYREAFDPTMEWRWKTVPSPVSPLVNGREIIAYAVHPDGRTIFISTGISTYTLDTSNGTWKELGEWRLPFIGQAFFDSGLDAWVGLHYEYDGWVCCCPSLTSLSASTTRQPECRVLMEKLVRRKEEDPKHWGCLRGKATSLTYMGDSRFAFFENVLCSDDLNDGCVIHITLFGLRYNHKGELKTKNCRDTRSYAVSKNTHTFSHAAFWM